MDNYPLQDHQEKFQPENKKLLEGRIKRKEVLFSFVNYK